MIPLAPDPMLPHRDDVLDPARAALLVERAYGLHGTGGRTLRVTYRVGESARAVCEVGGAAGSLVAVRMEPTSQAEGLFTRVASRLPSAARVEAKDAVLWRFPDDREVPGTDALTASSPTVGALMGAPSVRAELRNWTPGQSATAACRAGDGRIVAFAKAYAGDDEHVRAAAVHELLGRNGVAVPDVLATDDRLRLLVVAPAAGRRLRLDDDPGAMWSVGAALARVHAVPAPCGRRHARIDARALPRAAALVGRARPDLAERTAALAGRLADAPPPAAPDVLVHGDVHLGNILVDGNRAWLIDLDQAAAGQAAGELGSLLGLLRAQRVVGTLAPACEEAAAMAPLAGYASEAGGLPDRGAIAWSVSAALLVERALRAVRRVRLDMLDRLDALVTEAERVAREVSA